MTQDELENACRKRNEIMRFCCRHGRDGSGDFCNRPIALNLSRACDQTLNPFLNGKFAVIFMYMDENLHEYKLVKELGRISCGDRNIVFLRNPRRR